MRISAQPLIALAAACVATPALANGDSLSSQSNIVLAQAGGSTSTAPMLGTSPGGPVGGTGSSTGGVGAAGSSSFNSPSGTSSSTGAGMSSGSGGSSTSSSPSTGFNASAGTSTGT